MSRKESKLLGYLMIMFFLNSLVSGVVGVLAIVLGVCLNWAILPPVVDSMVR